jgi:chemotaxis protein CheD
MNIVVGVSEARASGEAEHVLVTYALGSCIGVALYDPVVCVGGLLHYQLPSSTVNPQGAERKPAMFADTGMNWIMNQMERMGAQKRRIRVRIAGGAKMLNDQTMFDIGRRNHAAIRKILFQNGMFIEKEFVGGTTPRTVHMNIADGMLTLKSNSETIGA